MNYKKFYAIILLSVFLLSFNDNDIIELPMTTQRGFGPFNSAMGGIGFYSDYAADNNPWEKTYPRLTALPQNLTDIRLGSIDTDLYQTVYQSYYQGDVTKEWYEELQKSWNWEPDPLMLSKKPVRCKIALAVGKDSSGDTKMVVDTNNNLDLSDDIIFTPSGFENWGNALENSINVVYERFINDKIVEVTSPLFIIQHGDMYMYNFPEHATVKIDGEEIAVASDAFTNLSYENPIITLIDDTVKVTGKALPENMISKNEYIEIKGDIYKNIGVNKYKNVLMLEKISLPKNQLYSTQVGYKALPFEGENFTTKTPVSLDGLKGKYVLLDFWAVWCGPCLAEFPALKKLYEKADKSKFEIVGIVGDSPADKVENLINEKEISWPQIMSDNVNSIVKKYGVTGYPTTFVIDPQGVIVSKNLRGETLENKILELLNE